MSIKVKRGLAINLPTLEEGELGFTTDSYEMYVGSDNGNILLNNGEILIRRNNGMLQYAQSSRKNQWFDICSLEEIRGDQGIQGIQGIQGVKGDKGDKGERGIQGEKGNPFTYADFTPDQLRALKGEKGDTGAKGERGLTGDKGDRGVGLNYAWSGTRLGVKRDTDAQYTYVDLRGADGKDGKQGERGERGIQGEKGETPSITHLEKQISDKSNELDTKFNTLTAKQQQDAEVVTARDGEVSLNARLERDLEKGKIHFVDVEGLSVSTESEEGYLENVEIHGNTWQDANNLSDIRSVGTKVEGQELYEIGVLSTGKNLFDNTLNSYMLIEDKTTMYNSFKIRLKPNTTYAIKHIALNKDFNLKRYIGFHTTPNTGNGLLVWLYHAEVGGYQADNIRKITTDNTGCIYLSFGYCALEELKLFLSTMQIQIEEGTQATQYEPYQEHKLTILSPTPLEKVGDVADRIICKDGVWGVEKNVATEIFDDSYAYLRAVLNVVSPTEYTSYCTPINGLPSINSRVMSDKFLPSTGESVNVVELGNLVSIHSNGKVYFRLKISELSTDTGEGFKEWIRNNNNIRVKYLTTQPQFIPLPHDQQIALRTFADRTHISFDTEIEPTIKAQVPKSLGATVNTHTTQIDNLNKELDRVKKLEESTVSTVTSDKGLTTIAETTQGYFEDVKIEGKTLVNLCTHKEPTLINATKLINHSMDFKLNTTYTIIFTSDKIANRIEFSFRNRTGDSYYTEKFTTTVNAGLNIIKIHTFSNVSNIIGSSFYIAKRGEDECTLSNILLLEGDHTDKDLSYFEGLKSVGQDSDEISVSSVNENLLEFDSAFTSIIGSWDSGNLSIDVVHNVSLSSNLCKVTVANNSNYHFLAFKTIIKKGVSYSYKFDSTSILGNGVSLFKDLSSARGQVVGGGFSGTFVANDDYNYIALPINKEVNEYSVSNFILTKDTQVTEYTPHQSDKKQILYYNPTTETWEKPVLREWDSIEKHSDGKYYYHKRSGEVVLNNKMNMSIPSLNGEFLRCDIQLSANSSAGIICDKFIYDKHTLKEKITHVNDSSVVIFIDKSKIATQDVAGFKQWLQANPTTVVYQLTQEEVYECTNVDLITYPNETNLIVSSGAIQPKITLKVLSNVSNVVKLLQEKVSILENKFIKGLQQVLAGDMMSLAHLLYPEDFALENDTPQVIPYIEEGDINE